MLDTHKLIYILPEMAYVAEMLPGKKQHSFTIQNFRQINGDFLKNDTFVIENILKLFSKIDQDQYHIILPDSLFTNTIISTTETGDAKIKKYVSETLLPSLDISTDTHHIETFVLTEFKGVAKVQISAFEKELANPLRAAAAQYDIQLAGVSPLSWTVKSIVSLEPSVTVLQIGSQIYTALQYIGVDQATISSVDDLTVVSETIKTLKGSEPSIQTIYLLGNSLVEEQLKDTLSSTLPIQQLSNFAEDDTKMPSYVRQIIEAGMKTLEIADYPVPKFELGKATEEDMSTYVAGNLNKVADKEDEETEEVSALPTPTPMLATPPVTATLTTPIVPVALADEVSDHDLLEAGDKAEVSEEEDTEEEFEEPENNTASISTAKTTDPELELSETEIESEEVAIESVSSTPIKIEDIEESSNDISHIEPVAPAIVPETAVIATTAKASDLDQNPTSKDSIEAAPKVIQPKQPLSSVTPEVDLSQFAQQSSSINLSEPMNNQTTPVQPVSKPVIKNQSGIGNMVKMIVITLVVFAITVAVGVGVGLTILTLTNKQDSSDSSNITVSPPPESITPVAEPSPTPVASASAVVREELDILIVNATGKAGYAGTFKTKLDAKEYKSVKTGNAKGDYETGNYVLMPEENTSLLEALSEDLGLDLTYQEEGYATEDSTSTNDAVVVLAE